LSRAAYLSFSVVMALLLGLGLRLWQYWRVFSVYEAAGQTDAPLRPAKPSARLLQAMRKLHFTWNPMIESGGPLVDPLTPYGGGLWSDLGPIANSTS
jgi:hypothetical protein